MNTTNENNKSDLVSDKIVNGETTHIDIQPSIDHVDPPIFRSLDFQNDPMDRLLKTDALVRTLSFSTGTTPFVPASYKILADYHALSFISNKLNNRHGIKATYKVTCRFTCNGMIRGALLVAFKPFPFSDSHINMDGMGNYMTNLHQLEKSEIVDFSNLKDFVFTLEPHYVESFSKINNTVATEIAEHWRLVTNLIAAPEPVTVAGSVTVTMYIYVSMVDYKLVHIRPESKLSDSFKSLSSNLKHVENIPYLGGTVNFLSKATSAAGSVLDLFGFSKPLHQVVQPVILYNKRISNVDTPDPAESIGNFASAHLEYRAVDGSQDPLNIEYMISHPTLVYHSSVISSGGLHIIPCCPGNYPISVYDGPSGFKYTPDTFILDMFSRYHIEKMHYTFQFFSHPSIRGFVTIYYLPYVDLATTYTSQWEVNTRKVVVSLTGSSSTTITVNWCAQIQSLPWKTMGTNTLTAEEPSNGMFVIRPSLISSPLTEAESVKFSVLYQGEGLSPINLTDQVRYGIKTFGEAVSYTVIPESRFAHSFSSSSQVEINDPNPYDPCGKSTSEKILSLRTLAQRPSIFGTAWMVDSPDESPVYVRTIPLPNTGDATDLISGRGNSGSHENCSAHTSYLSHITSPFLFYRGATRISVISPRARLRMGHSGDGSFKSYTFEKLDYRLHVLRGLSGRKPYLNVTPWTALPVAAKYDPRRANLLQNNNSLAYDSDERIHVPYSQPYEWIPSALKISNTGNTEVDHNWYDEYAFVTSSFNQYSVDGVFDLDVTLGLYISAGDDFDVKIWRGIPPYNVSTS